MVLVAWFVGCLVGYQCKASIDSIWGKHSLVATLSFLSHFLWLVCWLVRPAWLVGCLDLGKTHTVINDHGQGEKCNFLVRWLLGLLAVDCLRDTVLDGHASFSVCVLG